MIKSSSFALFYHKNYLNGGNCMSDSISTLAELKAASQTPTAARNRLTYLFDEGKFTELDAYALCGI